MISEAHINEDTKRKKERMKIAEWLANIVRLPQYYEMFMDQGFDDFEIIADITLNDLKEMGIDKIGHRKQILKYATKLKKSVNRMIVDDLDKMIVKELKIINDQVDSLLDERFYINNITND